MSINHYKIFASLNTEIASYSFYTYILFHKIRISLSLLSRNDFRSLRPAIGELIVLDTDKDAYIIFGVRDRTYEVERIKDDENRRTQQRMIDFF